MPAGIFTALRKKQIPNEPPYSFFITLVIIWPQAFVWQHTDLFFYEKVAPGKTNCCGEASILADFRITKHLERGTAGNMFAALPISEAWIT